MIYVAFYGLTTVIAFYLLLELLDWALNIYKNYKIKKEDIELHKWPKK